MKKTILTFGRSMLAAIGLFVVADLAYSQTTGDTGVLNLIYTALMNGVSSPGTPSSTGVVSVQGNASSIPVGVKSGSYTVVALDVSTITTGGTAVTVLNAGHASAGCVIVNSGSSTLVVNQIGTATGTTTAGNNIAIPATQQWNCIPSSNAVTAVSATSSYAFGGYGQQ